MGVHCVLPVENSLRRGYFSYSSRHKRKKKRVENETRKRVSVLKARCSWPSRSVSSRMFVVILVVKTMMNHSYQRFLIF